MQIIPRLGWGVLIPALILTGLGLFGVYAGEAGRGETPGQGIQASAAIGHELPAQTMRQSAFLGAGIAGVLLIQIVGYRAIGRYAYLMFGGVLVLLVLLIVARKVSLSPFIQPKRNTYRWIFIGPINIQVSEYTKVVYIIALAFYLRFRTNYRSFGGLFMPFLLTLVPVALILKEPDLGTSLLLLPTLFVMLYVAGAKIKHLLTIIGLGAVVAPAFYFSPFMSEYQRDRIHSLVNQDESSEKWRLNEGYQLNQSKIALGSGRIFGRGVKQSAFFRHNLLPEEHNDFIFAVVGHQWGFAGCMGVMMLYLTMIASGLTIASSTTDPFGRLLAVGVCALIFAQMAINIGMTIGLMPITGMTLPFVSMGGSSLIANYLAIGLLIDVARRRPPDLAKKPFEFAEA
ncbi:MAG TPA: FtsW/RodA/SpoVE family cell cycle protein [Phycisphaerae bacterium]|nr:FtsW/RodA/SpoVE family cell cycle protein [Phycisphaerae bacterium]